jgi:hypothetical protein
MAYRYLNIINTERRETVYWKRNTVPPSFVTQPTIQRFRSSQQWVPSLLGCDTMPSCGRLQTYRMRERFPFSELSSILKMEASRYPKMSVNIYQATRRHIPATLGLSYIAYKRLQRLSISSYVLMLTSSVLRYINLEQGHFVALLREYEEDHKRFIFPAIMGTLVLEGKGSFYMSVGIRASARSRFISVENLHKIIYRFNSLAN